MLLNKNLNFDPIKKIGGIAATDATTKVIGYLLLPFFLSFMSQKEFAEFSFIYLATTPFLLLITLNFYVSTIKLTSQSDLQEDKVSVLVTILTTQLCWLILLITLLAFNWTLAVTLFSNFFQITQNSEHKLATLIVLIVSSGIALNFYAFFVGSQKVGFLAAFIASRFILVSSCVYLCLTYRIPYEDSALNRLVGIASGETIAVLLSIYPIFGKSKKFFLNFNVLRNSLSISLPLIPGSITALLLAIIDKKIIVESYGSEVLAEYTLALSLMVPMQVIMASMMAVFSPILYEMRSHKETLSKLRQLRLACYVILLLCGIALSLFSYGLIFFEFIEKTYSSVPILILYLTAGQAAALSLHVNNIAFVKGNVTWVESAFGVCICLSSCILYLMLVPELGVMGVALTMFIVNGFWLLIGARVINKFDMSRQHNIA